VFFRCSFAAHKLTGPREVPNPSRALAGESSVNLSEEGRVKSHE